MKGNRGGNAQVMPQEGAQSPRVVGLRYEEEALTLEHGDDVG